MGIGPKAIGPSFIFGMVKRIGSIVGALGSSLPRTHFNVWGLNWFQIEGYPLNRAQNEHIRHEKAHNPKHWFVHNSMRGAQVVTDSSGA